MYTTEVKWLYHNRLIGCEVLNGQLARLETCAGDPGSPTWPWLSLQQTDIAYEYRSLWLSREMLCKTHTGDQVQQPLVSMRSRRIVPIILTPGTDHVKLYGGGFVRPHEDVELHIWPRTGTEPANETHMHCALRAVERAVHENERSRQSLTDNRTNYPLPHLDLESILYDFVSQEQQLLNDHQNEVSHLFKYLVKVFQECMCHVTMFSDGVHWRAVLFDGRTRVAYCVDPYGNQGPVSFQSRQPQRVLIALRSLLSSKASWRVQVTSTAWQRSNDGHSCGMWIIWLCEKFMKFVINGDSNVDFEAWAAHERPCQAALRARYHDLYYAQNASHNDGRHCSNHLADFSKANPKATQKEHALHEGHAMPAKRIAARASRLAAAKGSESRPQTRLRTPLTAKVQNSTSCAPTRKLSAEISICKRSGKANHLKTRTKAAEREIDAQQQTANEDRADVRAALSKAWKQPKLSFQTRYASNKGADATEPCRPNKDSGQSAPTDRPQEPAVACKYPVAPVTPPKASPLKTGITGDQPVRQNMKFIVTTWNVMGLTAVQEDVKHLMMRERDAACLQVFILTETKLIAKQHGKRWLKEMFEGLDVHYSSKAADDNACKAGRHRQGSAGVVVACPKYSKFGCFERCPDIPMHLLGNLIVMKNKHAKLTLAGVYMPCDEPQLREELYNILANEAGKAAQQNHNFVIAGDWNAAWTQKDRSSGTLSPSDKKHARLMGAMGMCPVQLDGRLMTYGVMSSQSQSRIDDIFINRTMQLEGAAVEEVMEMGERSDHLPLKAVLPLSICKSALHDIPSGEGKTACGKTVKMPSLQRPLNPGQRQMLRSYLEGVKGNDIGSIADIMQAAYQTSKNVHMEHVGCRALEEPVDIEVQQQFCKALAEHGVTNQRIDGLAASMVNLIQQLHLAALEVLPATVDKSKRRSFRPRVLGRQYQRLRRKRSWLIRRVKAMQQDKVEKQSTECGVNETINPYTCGPSPTNDKEVLKASYRQAGKEMKQLQAQHRSKSWQQHIRKMQKVLHVNKKKGHKLIFDHGAPPQKLESVTDVKTKQVHHEGTRVKKAVHEFFTQLMQPPNMADQQQAFPWEIRGKGQLDPFDLQEGHAGRATCEDEVNMLRQMDDPILFMELLSHLAKNKAPGPDSIPNELLQALPMRLKEAMRQLFVVMWLIGHTPDEWKVSKTVLLYKKGNPTLLQNWRPIALANTLYKAWTSMVTHVLSTYGERQGIIGSAQEGFRRYRNTSRQIQMAILLIEDAALFQQDLYSMYIDFSSAFNTINHRQLFMIMGKLGFPSIAIENVKSIYSNAVTHFATPYGDTDTIKIGRGTIQGDTLSPYLFLIFIEPLLRWLQHGGRGYAPGCLANTQLPKTIAALAYADDLKALTGSLSNLKLQAEKVARFSHWSGMEVNARKCAASAILHGQASAGLVKSPEADKEIRARIEGQIIIGKGVVPYLPPDQPYRVPWHFVDPYAQLGTPIQDQPCSAERTGFSATELLCIACSEAAGVPQ